MRASKRLPPRRTSGEKQKGLPKQPFKDISNEILVERAATTAGNVKCVPGVASRFSVFLLYIFEGVNIGIKTRVSASAGEIFLAGRKTEHENGSYCQNGKLFHDGLKRGLMNLAANIDFISEPTRRFAKIYFLS